MPVPTSEEIAELRRKHYNATMIAMRLANPELAVFRVQPDFAIPAHKPGQYTTLGLGYWEPRVPGCQEEQIKPGDETKLIRRAYSISHPIVTEAGTLFDEPNPGWLEFYVVLVRESDKAQAPALTPRLFNLKVGDRLYLGEKFTGHYVADGVEPDATVLFLSTGTGEAPNNYLLWSLLRGKHQGPLLSCCCVRYRRDLAYLDAHQALERRFANYAYVPLTTREAENVGKKAYVQDLLTGGDLEARLGAPLDPTRTHVFLCGNPKMIGVPTVDRVTGQKTYPRPTGVIEILEQRGFCADRGSKARGNVHFEEYW